MRVELWGVRGSLPTAGAGTTRYGGNTSCVSVRTREGNLVVLDAGTGIAALGRSLKHEERVDILLTHLHLDHIQGLGFFGPLFDPGCDVHLWGPASPTNGLRSRLTRYLSPPLFPVALRDLPCRLTLHESTLGSFEVPGLNGRAALVCHPGPTVGYRLWSDEGSMAYLPDHEPALGVRSFPASSDWTSGFELADGVDLLLHDAQYNEAEYAERLGWGHSTLANAVAFTHLAGARRLVAFHHDPSHDDDFLDAFVKEHDGVLGVPVTGAREGDVFLLEGEDSDLPRRTQSA
ncbi:MAG TPA: MBL fold metallo-hydrolase [Mycobacteriales bacterium]|nr:MBL fold metallo-hydrolase [Mycobacteriales bacterium]